MEELDLDAFIANIEQTAPQDELDPSHFRCQECNATLENVDDNYVCPNCSAQATNIMQFEETELHYDETGRAIVGQRVNLQEKKRKHSIDYGWAWSTDDAVVHILSLQIAALERHRLVPENFREAISNMWLKFWLDNVAPFIKDEYHESELIPIDVSKALKLRDIEVLVKVKDKVMIPTRLVNRTRAPRRTYRMLGTRFYSEKPDSSSDVDSDPSSDIDEVEPCEDAKESLQLDVEMDPSESNEQQVDASVEPEPLSEARTKNLSIDSVAILTLNRTLALIEAAARFTTQLEPLFAADIIRACNQDLIPFYGAFKTLPEGMNLNFKDKMMFQKTRPPTPAQLSRTAALLISKICGDRFPMKVPTPNLNRILERFIIDLNLPKDLMNVIKDKITFSHFTQTRSFEFTETVRTKRMPQYDRWAFTILLCHLKNLFNLNPDMVDVQSQLAHSRSVSNEYRYFPIGDWLRQLSLRLNLILHYDPFVLFHPLADVRQLEVTPQVCAYVETILDYRASSTTRAIQNLPRYEPSFRNELSDFLDRELPKTIPGQGCSSISEQVERPTEVRYPIRDALERTERFWASDLETEHETLDIIRKDFSDHKIVTLDRVPKWCIYDGAQPTGNNLTMSHNWPNNYNLLLTAGAYLCFCEPRELLNETRWVEEFYHPHTRTVKRRQAARGRQTAR